MGFDVGSESVLYKPLMSTSEGETHLRTGKQSTGGGSAAGQRSSPPCGHTLVLTELLLLKTLQIFTPWRSADGDAAALCTPAHPSLRRDGPGLTSEGLRPLAAHLKTHISCKKALGCRRLPSRFNLLRSWAPSLSLLAMKSLMLHTYIECSFFFLLRGKLYVLRRVLVLHG